MEGQSYNYANRYGGDSPDSLVIIEAISRIAQALERIADQLEKLTGKTAVKVN